MENTDPGTEPTASVEGNSSATTVPELAPGTIAPQIVDPSQRSEPSASRKAFVREWTGKVQSAVRFFEKQFKQMSDDMKFARGEQWVGGNQERYTCNIVQRHLNQRVASLYAKNPKIIARRRRTLDFALWDETPQTVQGVVQQMQAAQLTGNPAAVNPQSIQLIQDIMQGMNKRKLMDKIAATMEIVAEYTLKQQQPGFKNQMKQLVRRVLTTGVGYISVGIQRTMQKRPEDAAKISDLTSQIEMMMREGYDIQNNKDGADSPDIEALKVQLRQLQAAPDNSVQKEGIVIDFPKSNKIIIDPRCSDIVGFVGAKWIAEEFLLTTDDIKEVFHVDLQKGKFTAYTNPDEKERREISPERDSSGRYKETASRVRVWKIYSKDDKMVYVVAEGYNDFLVEPGYPEVKLNRFWPIIPVVFNPREDEESIYPQSDVYLIRDMQMEYNRQREGQREHRFANRPKTIVAKGRLSNEDILAFKDHPANAVIQIDGMQPNEKVEDVLQPMKMPPLDPALYDVNPAFEDIQRVVGSQEADLGGTSGASATETNISESNRMTSIASNIDDLEDALNEMAGAIGEIAPIELSPDSVKKIAGPGAVWPELSPQDVTDELYLEIEAGSNGRPNKAAEIDNFTKLAPIAMQIPGFDPLWWARQLVMRLDDRLDVTDALAPGLQSIVNMNAAQQQGGAQPTNQPQPGKQQDNPALQGPQGAANAPQPPQTTPPMGGGSPMIPQVQH